MHSNLVSWLKAYPLDIYPLVMPNIHIGAETTLKSGWYVMDGWIYNARFRGNLAIVSATVREAKGVTKGL